MAELLRLMHDNCRPEEQDIQRHDHRGSKMRLLHYRRGRCLCLREPGAATAACQVKPATWCSSSCR